MFWFADDLLDGWILNIPCCARNNQFNHYISNIDEVRHILMSIYKSWFQSDISLWWISNVMCYNNITAEAMLTMFIKPLTSWDNGQNLRSGCFLPIFQCAFSHSFGKISLNLQCLYSWIIFIERVHENNSAFQEQFVQRV